ncbi:MAG: Lrp/AsnC family transcriptional regulator [Flavobacteriaceae bacterium]|nr:Lrp/AsnC family transcriptional regulator [Flavobacteriaceae bacterium]
MEFDSIDKKLLYLLQKDCKVTTKLLSLQLNLSVTAVYERIKKLEKAGVIEKYVAVLSKEKINKDFVVLCHIRLVKHSNEYLTKFESEVVQLKEVLECYNVSGEYDYILKVVVNNMKDYREFINSKLTRLQHIGSTHSTFIISELKNSTEILL